MSKKRKVYLSDIIAKPYLKLLKDKQTRHQVVYGGRASAKSSFHEIKIPYLLLSDPKAEAVVIRKDYKSHRNTTFAGLKIGFERLGWKLKPARDYPRGNTGSIYISTEQGNHIHFTGLHNLDSTKGARPHYSGNEIKIVWMMEITEFNSEEEMNQLISNYVRGQKDWFIILYEFNPHSNPNHWTYAWLEKMKARDDALTLMTTYKDLPEQQRLDFLGEAMLDEIEMLEALDYEQYKNIYLGLPANIAGNIYKKFDYDRHTFTLDETKYMDINIGVDYGETDATVFTAIGYTKNREAMHVLKTFYHKNKDSKEEKTIDDYVEDLFKFAEDIWSKYQTYFTIHIDSASKHFWNFFRKEKVRRRIGYFKVETTNKTKKTKRYDNAIEERIGITNLMLSADYLKINKASKELIDAILYAERDNHGNRRDDASKDIDSLDSFEYAWLPAIEKIENAILRNKGYSYDDPLPYGKYRLQV